jgi:streptomycin 6-kinase
MNTQIFIQNTINIASKKWSLNNIRQFLSGSTNNYVAQAYSEIYKKDVVLKILMVNTHEPEALMLFNGNGCVKLLEYDPIIRCFLLEYVKPGTSLAELFPKEDNKAIEITANLITILHAQDLLNHANGFQTINQWLNLLYDFKSKKISSDILEKAQQLSKDLLGLKPKLYLLHGDLHHENILKNSNSWIAIDPKGVIGPLEYEVGRFIMNPIPHLLLQTDTKAIIKNRIDKFSNFFDFDKQELIDWTFVQAVLSACWTEQGGSEDFFNYFVKFAKTIESL